MPDLRQAALAAHRFGVDTVIIPKKNENDLDDLPADVRKALKFVLAEHVEDVLDAALVPKVTAKNGHKAKK